MYTSSELRQFPLLKSPIRVFLTLICVMEPCIGVCHCLLLLRDGLGVQIPLQRQGIESNVSACVITSSEVTME